MDYKEKLKDIINSNKTPFVDIDTFLKYFPELKESEDEKIKSAAIEFVKQNKSFNYCLGISKEDVLSWLEKQGEQKPAWSEEDEKIKESIITGLEMLKDGASDKSLIALYNKKINWLESLKEKVSPQPKQEWSEEDEYHKRQILRILKDNGCSQTLQEKTEKWIEERLKSLRPQSQWKPSEEQMDVLETAVSSLQSTALESLYNDLNKL